MIKVFRNKKSWNPSFIRFELESDRRLTFQEIEAEQIKAGYDPLGYGLYGLSEAEQRRNEKTIFIYHWQCSASCD